MGDDYAEFRLHSWRKTGCLMTADGSEDDSIKPEGLKDYVVPPPALVEPSSNLPVTEDSSNEEDEHEEEQNLTRDFRERQLRGQSAGGELHGQSLTSR